ncbi:MAG: class I SAM-dependent rRNA methyltransferase [Thermoanaerobaculia bacterium]
MWVLTLKPGREESVLRRHPWVFSGAVAGREGDPGDGLARVRSASGRTLGFGLASPLSQIEARLWTFSDTPLDGRLLRSRFEAARCLRERLIPRDTTGSRLLHSEGDRTPGLVADRYGDTHVLLFTSEGAVRRRVEIEDAYREIFAPGRLVVRSEDGGAEGRETAEPEAASFREHGLEFSAEISSGQKTGFFLDQRENRNRVRALSSGRTVLNLFSYSGGFSVAALAGGAKRAVDVDSSGPALGWARENRARNGFPTASDDFVEADVFQDLRRRVGTGESWDIVVCDPPAFAKKKRDVDRAARGYKDVFRLAMSLVAPGGILVACSCSGRVSADLFQKIVFSAALDSKTTFSIFEKAGAAPDHPVSLDCPETEYLKAFFLVRSGDAGSFGAFPSPRETR